MLYRRRDFRPDKQPRKMKNYFTVWSRGVGYKNVTRSSRSASVHRQDFKNEHNNRQRTHNRKVIEKELGDDHED